MAMAILGGLGAAIALALLLDMVDRRIRLLGAGNE
jgi:hypothetical protein